MRQRLLLECWQKPEVFQYALQSRLGQFCWTSWLMKSCCSVRVKPRVRQLRPLCSQHTQRVLM